MIKINLLPQRRSRKVDKGQQSLMLGLLIVIAAGALLFFLVHRPLRGEIEELERTSARLRADNSRLEKNVQGFDELEKAVQAAKERSGSILTLSKARAVPAHMLWELSQILTTSRAPTMTQQMAERVEQDPNRELASDWDPKHVWVTSFTEKQGEFKLEGGAQSDGDMTQLAKRLQASVYFDNVIPEGGIEASDKNSGITFYRFTISGRVVY